MKDGRLSTWLVTLVIVIVVAACSQGQPVAPTAATTSAPGIASDSTGRTPVPMHADLTGTAWLDLDNRLGCAVTPYTVVAKATGPWSHMGVVQMSSQHCITGVDSDGAPLFAGTAVYRAANGDELHTSYTGTMHPGPTAPMAGHFTITGGTGRFADASGEGEWSGQVTMNSPSGPWPTVWHKSGRIVY